MVAVSVIVVVELNKTPATPSPTTTVPPTTIWPYGQPEYSIEVPEGYEDLLPGTESVQPSPPEAEKSPKNKPERPLSPPKAALKAEPYILGVRKIYEGGGDKAHPHHRDR